MYKLIIEKNKRDLEKAVSFLKNELQKMRSGRATPVLVEDIIINCFGSSLPLKNLASISCPEPRQILIKPWSDAYLEPIEKALKQADLGGLPAREGNKIRINLPALTEEFRNNLVRKISRKAEESRQIMRKYRDEAWKEIQEMFRQKEISEDDKFKAKDELQDLIDDYSSKIEELVNKKKEEIMQ